MIPVYETTGFLDYGSAVEDALIPVPSGTEAGDIVVVNLGREYGTSSPPSAVVAPDEDWHLFPTLDVDQGDGTSTDQTVAWKRAEGSDTGTYDFTWTGTAHRHAEAHRISGAAPTGDPWDADTDHQASASAGSNTPSVQIVTSGDDRLLLWMTHTYGGSSSWTPPSGMTERTERGNMSLATEDFPAEGDTGSTVGTNGQVDLKLAFLGALSLEGEAPEVTGVAAGAFGGLGTAAGAPVIFGAAIGDFGGLGQAFGAVSKVGAGLGAFGGIGSASGLRSTAGTATGSFGGLGTGTGVPEVLGQAQGAFTFGGIALGLRIVSGPGLGTFGGLGTAHGEVAGTITGAGTGTFGFIGTALGVPTKLGAGVGAFGFQGSGAGVPTRNGSGLGAFIFGGPASGLREVLGAATGAFVYTGSAHGVILGPEVASTGPLRVGAAAVAGPSGSVGPDRAGTVTGDQGGSI